MRFFTKRKQQLADLDSQPPQSLVYLRQLIHEELARLSADVATLEAEFYDGGSAMAFVKSLTAPFREALSAHRLPELSSLRQLQTVIRMARDPDIAAAASLATAQPMHVSRDAADRINAMQNRLLEFVPGRFSDLICRTQRLLNLEERYLRSFYDPDLDPPVDTGKLYDASARVWSDRVRHCVTHLYQLPQLFMRGGLSLARFAASTLDLLERCEMLACPVLGMFADCCERLREAARLMEEWVRQDEQYVLYIRNDCGELEREKRLCEQKVKKARHRSSMLQYRIKQLVSEKARLSVELETLLEKEAELIVDDEALYQETNGLQVDIEIKEFRRDELKRNPGTAKREEIQIKWDELQEEIRRLRMRLPVLRRRQSGVRLKMAWIETKRTEHKNACNQIHTLENDRWTEKRACVEREAELERIVASMEKCKEIQHLKSSPDILKKIFYNMPLPTDSAPHRSSQEHDRSLTKVASPHSLLPEAKSPLGQAHQLEQILGIVGRRLGRDWHRLYRALPFVPPRGEQTIDSDIQDIEAEFVGDALKERAKRALQRWRRFHTRARVEDLCLAVDTINRQDIATAIDAVLNPIDSAVKEEPIPDSIPKDLIPYYRDVQKFDRLRAAHRI